MPQTETTTKQFHWKRVLLVLFAAIGLAIMTYLTYIHITEKQSFCDISETVSCDIVTTSIYSEIFGIPISVLGVLYFGLVLFLVLFKFKENLYQFIFMLTLFVLMPSLYLTAVEFIEIKAFCPLCESSKVLMLLILVVSITGIQRSVREFINLSTPVIITGIVAAIVTFFAQTGNVVQHDYTEFVENLNNQGVVYYKSFRCNNCKRLEKNLGEAYVKLNSVECHPDGDNPQTELCLQMGINKTPTLLIQEDGREIDRLEGLKSLEEIADWAGVELDYK